MSKVTKGGKNPREIENFTSDPFGVSGASVVTGYSGSIPPGLSFVRSGSVFRLSGKTELITKPNPKALGKNGVKSPADFRSNFKTKTFNFVAMGVTSKGDPVSQSYSVTVVQNYDADTKVFQESWENSRKSFGWP